MSVSASALSLCQSSIHNFISGLPCHASELCLSAVNNFLEDQVADPKKLRKNIYRVKSVFSGECFKRCRAKSSGWLDMSASGDCPPQYKGDKTTILTLPPKVRMHIWEYLEDKSVRTLRSVCSVLKDEMDFEVGLSVTLNSHSFQNVWIKTVTLRSCFIKQLDSAFQINCLARPEKLQCLCIDPDLDMDIDMLELMIRKFWNLRQLTVYTEDVVELRNDSEQVVYSGISSKLITRLEDQFQLTSIDVKFDTCKWKLKWNIKLKPQVFETAWTVENVIGHFGMNELVRVPNGKDLSRKSLKIVTLSIPFVQERDRYVWLRVLQTQNVLSSLTCDLNATHWKEYQPIIRKSRKTLKKIFILNLSNTPSTRWPSSAPFDWNMFDSCRVLEEITLIADTFMRSVATSQGSTQMPRRYVECANIVSLKTCPLLRSMWLENFKLVESDLIFLKDPIIPGHKEGRFELCCLKNCQINGEEVEEKQVGRKSGRNRSFECLCFGTNSYDDAVVENYEKFRSPPYFSALGDDSMYASDIDIIDRFADKCEIIETPDEGYSHGIADKLNWAGALALTAWLYWCN